MAAGWRRLIQCIGMLCLIFILSGQAGTGIQKPSTEKPQTSPFKTPAKPETRLTQAERNGQAIYSYYCIVCHGETGKGDGFNSYNLSVHPRDFSDHARMKTLSDDRIKQVILNGGRSVGLSPLMPPWGGVLTEKQVSGLIGFIRTF
jgi:mono/diheme cytochrome c family protein